MKVALNGWQRLWVVFSALTLACVLALLTLIWPHRDLDVLSDIASPKCKPFLEVPAGFFAEQPPERNEACYSLQSLCVQRRLARSVGDSPTGVKVGTP